MAGLNRQAARIVPEVDLRQAEIDRIRGRLGTMTTDQPSTPQDAVTPAAKYDAPAVTAETPVDHPVILQKIGSPTDSY